MVGTTSQNATRLHRLARALTAPLLVTSAWTTGWLVLQYVQYASKVGEVRTKDLSLVTLLFNEGTIAATFGFLFATLGLYAAFAWANAGAFRTLLAPRLTRPARRLAWLLVQLMLVTLAVHLVNAWFYPNSRSGQFWSLFLSKPVAQLAALALVAAALSYFALWMWRRLGTSRLAAAVVVLLGIPLATTAWQHRGPSAATPTPGKPDIIVIGLDSLRPDHVGALGAPLSVTPNLNQWLRDSFVFTDTLTPLPNTFPATTSILTGQWPTTHGARANLFPPSQVDRGASLALQLRKRGYATVMAMDETRFANIDGTFGFARLVGPRMGAFDFVMSIAADNVLVNLGSGAPGIRHLFPNIGDNRAVSHAYRPALFSDSLDAAIADSQGKPLFLYAHFCAAHWPYLPRPIHESQDHPDRRGDYADSSRRYLESLTVADRQFQHLLQSLEARGRLRNAVVVVLSDHGEDFNMAKDRIDDSSGFPESLASSGHGGSAVRAPQVSVLLALRGYGSQRLPSGRSSAPASLVDVAPTVADLVGLPAGIRYDGISLRAQLQPASAPSLAGRVRFVESNYLPAAMEAAEIDESQVVAEAAHMYMITPRGRVQLREEFVDHQVSTRQRAAHRGDWAVLAPKTFDGTIKVLNRPARRFWALAEAPPQARAGELLGEICQHWRDDRRFHDAYCEAGPALAGGTK